MSNYKKELENAKKKQREEEDIEMTKLLRKSSQSNQNEEDRIFETSRQPIDFLKILHRVNDRMPKDKKAEKINVEDHNNQKIIHMKYPSTFDSESRVAAFEHLMKELSKETELKGEICWVMPAVNDGKIHPPIQVYKDGEKLATYHSAEDFVKAYPEEVKKFEARITSENVEEQSTRPSF